MKKLALLSLILLFNKMGSFSQIIDKRIYGTWTCSYMTNNDVISNNVTWIFNQNGFGSYKNISNSASKNGITCTTTHPFTWKINKNHQIIITSGVASSKCVTSRGHSKQELEDIETSRKNSISREVTNYDFKFESSTIMLFGGERMKRN